MKQISKIILFAASTITLLGAGFLLQSQPAQAACTPSASQKCCGDIPVTIDVGCRQADVDANGSLVAYVFAIIRVVSGAVGIAVVGTVIFGGITYMTARDNAGQAQKGIAIIRAGIIALVCFFFLAAMLTFLIPGGLWVGIP